MRRLILAIVMITAPTLMLGSTSASACGGYGYGYGGGCGCCGAYGYSYYRPAYYYGSYYRPRYYGYAYYRPAYYYGSYYRPRYSTTDLPTTAPTIARASPTAASIVHEYGAGVVGGVGVGGGAGRYDLPVCRATSGAPRRGRTARDYLVAFAGSVKAPLF